MDILVSHMIQWNHSLTNYLVKCFHLKLSWTTTASKSLLPNKSWNSAFQLWRKQRSSRMDFLPFFPYA